MLTLYQFPISHYCEKVRWALEYKGLPYKVVNLLPGLHVPFIKRHCRSTTVPVLHNGETYIQGSNRILDWLEEHCPEPSINGANTQLQEEIVYWERFLDKEAGVPFRALAYYHFFKDNPKAVLDMWCEDTGFLATTFMRVTFPLLKKVLTRKYGLVNDKVEKAEEQFMKSLDALDAQLGDRHFLVGDQLSRADISLGSMLVHVMQPPEFDFKYPPIPEALQAMKERVAHRPALQAVSRLYRNHRLHSPTAQAAGVR